MISKETLENIKEVLYMNAKNGKFCCACMEHIAHSDHCFHMGTFKIGTLEVTLSKIDGVICDTSSNKFRLKEVMEYLKANGYIEFKDITPEASMMGVINFFITSKLYLEMSSKEFNESSDVKKWY